MAVNVNFLALQITKAINGNAVTTGCEHEGAQQADPLGGDGEEQLPDAHSEVANRHDQVDAGHPRLQILVPTQQPAYSFLNRIYAN